MFCPKCGAQNDDNAYRCTSCGGVLQGVSEPAQYAVPATQVPNYLVQSILVTICCCVPLGIVAIVYAAQVNGKLASGDIDGAMASSKNAKMWCWIAFGLGFVANMLVFGVQFAIGFSEAMKQSGQF